MVTKKQHYYPRTLLKHFADDNNKFHVFMNLANKDKFKYINYSNVCVANNTYEVDSKEKISKSVNWLEHKFGFLEQKLGPIIDKIIKNYEIKIWSSSNIGVSEEEIDFLYLYMFIQFIRTDRGRINFIDASNKGYVSREYPISIQEIQSRKDDIKKFNSIFSKEGNFEKLLTILKKPKIMNFHIFTGDFITSDNPVIGLDDWEQIFMPISQNLCLGFQTDRFSCSNNTIVSISKEKNEYLNHSQIETANYFIISKNKFNSNMMSYIKSRFSDSNWQKKTTHFKKKK